MRLFLVCAIASIGCRKPAEPPPPPAEPPPHAEQAPPLPPELSWSNMVDAGGKLAEVKQIATGRRTCTAQASLGDRKLWSVDACLATRFQLRFVSPDARSLIVLTPEPDSDDLVLGRVFRDGQRVAELTPASLRLAPAAARIEAGKLRWLGQRDQRATADGVEVQLLDGSLRTIRFDAAGIEEPRPQRAVAQAPTCAPCSYTDAEGTYHVVESYNEIPPRYRKQAGRIRGELQRSDSAPTAPASAPAAPDQPARPPDIQAQAVPQQQPADGVPRNSQGENFIEYTRRIAGQPPGVPPNADLKAKCIDNSGASVPCSETGMQAHH